MVERQWQVSLMRGGSGEDIGIEATKAFKEMCKHLTGLGNLANFMF